MSKDLTVLGLVGSLRSSSYNGALLRAAAERAPPRMQIKTFDLSNIPLFNADVEAAGDPQPVARLKTAILEADALLIATPEYNHGVPGVLKNVLDWASRPSGKSPLWETPVAIVGASPGQIGTARAQTQLRQTFAFTNCLCMNQPELLVFRAHQRFDEAGNLIDAEVAARLEEFLAAFERWIRRFGKQGEAI